MKRRKEQEERAEGERLTRQAAAIDELWGGDDEVSGRCQEKSSGGLDRAGREAMSLPAVTRHRSGVSCCKNGRGWEGGKNPNPSDLADSVTMRTAAGRVIVRRVSEEVKERRRQAGRRMGRRADRGKARRAPALQQPSVTLGSSCRWHRGQPSPGRGMQESGREDSEGQSPTSLH